jgi:hypothetical protein
VKLALGFAGTVDVDVHVDSSVEVDGNVDVDPTR